MAGATHYVVAVMSDDSDFIALYAKLRQLAEGNYSIPLGAYGPPRHPVNYDQRLLPQRPPTFM